MIALQLDASDLPQFTYDRRLARYRYKDSGRLLSLAAVQAISQRRVGAIASDMRTLGSLLLDGKMSLATWQEAMAHSISEMGSWSFTIARGGQHVMGEADYLRLRSHVSRQLDFLTGFATDLSRGSSIAPSGSQVQMTRARFLARLELYCKSGNAAKAIAQDEAAKRDRGAVAMRRILGASDRHCQSCLSYASMGVQAIGRLPLPGESCECGNRCLCSVKYLTAKELSGAVAG